MKKEEAFSKIIARLQNGIKAFQQGHPIAQFNLGLLYQQGLGVNRDINEAMEWWTKSAEQGCGVAQNNLGCAYADLRDYVQAYKWLALAAAQGEQNAPEAMDELSLRMTPGQVAEAQRLANVWKPSAA